MTLVPTMKCQLIYFIVIGSYERMQEVESSKLLFDMLTRPEESGMNAKRYAASLVFTLSYGRRLPDDDQDLIAVLDILDGFIEDCYPGAHLVDTFPVLDKILPSFLAPWRAAATKKHEREMQVRSSLVLVKLSTNEKQVVHSTYPRSQKEDGRWRTRP